MHYGDYISSKELIAGYILKNGSDVASYFDEDLCKIFIEEAVDEILTADNYKLHIEYLILNEMGKVELPINFVRPIQIAYRGNDANTQPFYKKTISQYIKRSLEESCNITVDIKKVNCDCTGDCECNKSHPIEVDITDDMLASNPELVTDYSKFLVGYTGNYSSHINKEFKVINPSPSYFYRAKEDVRGCNIPNLNSKVEYDIDSRVLSVSNGNNSGEILISYLGYRLDEDGWLLIPDKPYIIKAIESRLDAGFALHNYKRHPTQTTRAFWMDMVKYSESIVKKAKSQLRTLSPDRMNVLVKNILMKRLPTNPHNTHGNITDPRYYPTGHNSHF